MPQETVPTCPLCDRLLKAGAFVLCRRDDDDRHTCRVVWGCSEQHVWWKWADRPSGPLELCPHPDLFSA
jgi:hypothetical protein